MKIFAPGRVIALAIVTLAVTACATSKPIGQWRNPDISGKFDNILILAVTSRSTRRRVFEDQFVDALAAIEVEAVPSYTLITSTQDLSRMAIEQAIKGKNLGAVLVTRLVGVKDKETYQRPDNEDENMNYYTYYDNALEKNSSGYYNPYRVLTLETNLYDAASTELVWSMQSEIMDASRERTVIQDQINLTINTLKSQGLIGG